MTQLTASASFQLKLLYGILFILTLCGIITTNHKYPLLSFESSDLDWSNAWLVATIIDYYGSTFCFTGVVISSETSWSSGIAWSLGFCLLGSPVCCVWVFLRIRSGGNLRLEGIEHHGESSHVLS